MQPDPTGWERSALDYEVQQRQADMIAARETGGWGDWSVFAAVMMWMIGAFSVLNGVVAVLSDELLVVHQDQAMVLDLTAWGWTHVAIGTLLIFAGAGVMRGRLWARIIGITMATLNAIAQFVFLPVTPFWSFTAVILDVLVIFALTLHPRQTE